MHFIRLKNCYKFINMPGICMTDFDFEGEREPITSKDTPFREPSSPLSKQLRRAVDIQKIDFFVTQSNR